MLNELSHARQWFNIHIIVMTSFVCRGASMVELLLENGAAVDLRNDTGRTA